MGHGHWWLTCLLPPRAAPLHTAVSSRDCALCSSIRAMRLRSRTAARGLCLGRTFRLNFGVLTDTAAPPSYRAHWAAHLPAPGDGRDAGAPAPAPPPAPHPHLSCLSTPACNHSSLPARLLILATSTAFPATLLLPFALPRTHCRATAMLHLPRAPRRAGTGSQTSHHASPPPFSSGLRAHARRLRVSLRRRAKEAGMPDMDVA